MILITGADGFIGSALRRRLKADGVALRAALRRNICKSTALDEDTCEVGEIGPKTDWSLALKGVDVVVHLAARAHIMRDTASDPLAEFRKVNVEGAERLARQAVSAGVRRIVFLSSVKVNGEESPVSYKENDIPDPRDPYGQSKLEAEQALRKIETETGMEVIIIRPPLVYGPGVKANFLSLLKIVQRGIPLPLASVTNKRNLIYIGNLVDAIAACSTHTAAAGKTYLVSDGEDVSTPELIRRTAAALGVPARIFPFPVSLLRMAGRLTGKADTIERLVGSLTVDSSKIRQELGWKPPFTMEQGLAETARWFKDKSNSK